MTLSLNPEVNKTKEADLAFMDSYVSFRAKIPKPTAEEAHIRHILRYYVARSLLKSDYQDVYVLPEIDADEKSLTVDVAGRRNGELVLALVEPESVTDQTIETLDQLKDSDAEVIVVHSQYGNAGEIPTRFEQEIESGRFRIMAVVPPPFDDVYEYDIWMFETTFRNVMEK